jgi:hypothetical protein
MRKSRKKIIPPVLPVNRNIDPEILGGDKTEFSGGNPDSFIALDTLQGEKTDPQGGGGDPQGGGGDPQGGGDPKKKQVNICKRVHFPQWG